MAEPGVLTILVTGGAGFIGSHVVDAYLRLGHRVVVVDDLSRGARENVNTQACFHRVDVCSSELDDIFRAYKPAVVNHHAAQVRLSESLKDPMHDAWVNIMGSLNVLKACAEHGVRKVIFASSGGAIYGDPETLPAEETQPLRPISPYGASKAAVEHYLRVFEAGWGLCYVALRYANVYGPRQRTDNESGVIAIFTNAMVKGETPIIYGDGEQVRDYVYVDDVVEANVLALDDRAQGAFNIGTGVGTRVKELYAQLSELIGYRGNASYGPPREAEVEKSVLRIDCARRQLGWEPRVPLAEGLRLYVDHVRQGGGPRVGHS